MFKDALFLTACCCDSDLAGVVCLPGWISTLQDDIAGGCVLSENFFFLLLSVHVGLLAWSATRHAPVVDEVGHLPAGLSHWHLNRRDELQFDPVCRRILGKRIAVQS